jgi:hypothetical protein
MPHSSDFLVSLREFLPSAGESVPTPVWEIIRVVRMEATKHSIANKITTPELIPNKMGKIYYVFYLL